MSGRAVRLPRLVVQRLVALEREAGAIIADQVQALRDAGAEIPADYQATFLRAPDGAPVALEIPTPAAPEEPTDATRDPREDDSGDDRPGATDHPGDAAD